MVTIKHKVTIKTKTAQEETPAAVESPVVTLKRKQPEAPAAPKAPESTKVEIKKKQPEPPVTPPTPGPEKKSNTGKIIGGVVAAAAIFAGIYFFGIKNSDTTDGTETPTEQIAQAGNTENEVEGTETPATDNGDNTPEAGEGAASGSEATEANPSEASGTSTANETPSAGASSNTPAPAKPEAQQAENSANQNKPTAQQSQAKQTTTSNPSTPSASEPLSGDVAENARRVIRGDFGNGKVRKDKLGAAYSEIQGKVNEMYRQGLVH